MAVGSHVGLKVEGAPSPYSFNEEVKLFLKLLLLMKNSWSIDKKHIYYFKMAAWRHVGFECRVLK